MDFTTGLTTGLFLGATCGIILGFYFFAESLGVSESDTVGKELTLTEPIDAIAKDTKNHSGRKRRKKGITGRSKKKRQGGGRHGRAVGGEFL